MALSFGIDPQSKKYGYDYYDYGRKSALKLMSLRKKMTKEFYPEAIVYDLLVEAYTPELGWDKLGSCFHGVKRESDYLSAISTVETLLGPFRENVQSRSEKIVTPTFKTGGLSFSGLREKARLAMQGDNVELEDLEFSFVCYSARYPVLIRWAAMGLMGYDKGSAYMELVDVVFVDPETGRNFTDLLKNDFPDAIRCFDASIAGSIGGAGPQLPRAYQQLPPLF